MKAIKGTSGKGMILPFQPMALTFHDVCYYVPLPQVLLPRLCSAISWMDLTQVMQLCELIDCLFLYIKR